MRCRCLWQPYGEPECTNTPAHFIAYKSRDDDTPANEDNTFAELYCEAHYPEAIVPWELNAVPDDEFVGAGRLSWFKNPNATLA